MGNSEIAILSYADYIVLVAESEDDLQRLIRLFNCIAKSFNMMISTQITKSMATSKLH